MKMDKFKRAEIEAAEITDTTFALWEIIREKKLTVRQIKNILDRLGAILECVVVSEITYSENEAFRQ